MPPDCRWKVFHLFIFFFIHSFMFVDHVRLVPRGSAFSSPDQGNGSNEVVRTSMWAGNPSLKRHFLSVCGSIFAFEGNWPNYWSRNVFITVKFSLATETVMSFLSLPTPPPPPKKIVHNNYFQFPLGITVVAREIEDTGFAKFTWGVNKVHYGLGEKSEVLILCSCWN